MWASVLGISECRICGTTSKRHRTAGLCGACYESERKKKNDLSAYQRKIAKLAILSDVELAYMAGLIDGEGCVTAERPAKNKRGNWQAPRVRIIVGMTDESVIRWLRETLGGGLYIKPVQGNHKASYNWTLNGRLAILLLQALLPYLRVKLPQARVVIQFGLIRLGARHVRTEEELTQLNILKDQLLILNKRGL